MTADKAFMELFGPIRAEEALPTVWAPACEYFMLEVIQRGIKKARYSAPASSAP